MVKLSVHVIGQYVTKLLSLVVTRYSRQSSLLFIGKLQSGVLPYSPYTDDLMPNVPISCLLPGRVDPEVHGLKVIIDCPQPGSSRTTYRPPPISRWSKCGGNDGPSREGMSKVPKETQPKSTIAAEEMLIFSIEMPSQA